MFEDGRLHLVPDAEAGVPAPPAESSTADLPAFEPDRETGEQASPAQLPGVSSVAAAGGGPPSGTTRAIPPVPQDPNATAISGQAGSDEWQSIREAASRFGYTGLSGFDNDEAALIHLVQQAQRAQQADAYAQLGHAIAPELQQYQEFRKTQAQAPKAGEGAAYLPPPFDPKWMGLVDRDPASGMYFSRPGVNPAVAEAVNKRLEWQERFTHDPVAVMDQYAQAKLPELVQREVKSALQTWQQDHAVESILMANDPWLYQRDAAGRYAQGPNGRVPTPEGAAYIQQVRSLQSAGVTDPTMQDALARQLVAGQLALARLQGGQQASPQPAQAQAAYRPNVNPLQTRGPLERQQVPGAVEPNGEGMSLRDMLQKAYDDAGYTDQRFQQELGF